MVHLIFAIKCRKKLLIKYGAEIKQLFYDISKEKDFEIIEMEIDKDRIHVLIRYSTTKSVVGIVKLLNQISTYRIWGQNSNDINLRKYFWEEQTFWSDGYFICSIGQISIETIRKYIQEQG